VCNATEAEQANLPVYQQQVLVVQRVGEAEVKSSCLRHTVSRLSLALKGHQQQQVLSGIAGHKKDHFCAIRV